MKENKGVVVTMPRRGLDKTTAPTLSVNPGDSLSLVGKRESFINVMYTFFTGGRTVGDRCPPA